MKTLTKIFAILIGLGAGLITSCNVIYDDLPECDPGTVRINIFVESFLGDLSQPPITKAPGTKIYTSSSESCAFHERIKRLNYYLYKDGVLYQQGPLDCSTCQDPIFMFERKNLPTGNYHLVLTGNCSEKVIRGSVADPANFNILYQDGEDADDFFVDSFDFKVSDDKGAEYDTQLKRMHGVVRYTFSDVPSNITAIEVSMDGLTSSGCVMGTYSDDYIFTKKIPTNLGRAEVALEPTVVGVFPTAENGISSWNVKLYNGSDPDPLFSRTVSTDVRVVRNDLLDLHTSFDQAKGTVLFYVGKNLVWEAPIEAGGILE